ncbi:MAG: DUF748 domain-containing protein [Algoriphagus sp.]|nr:DUF748 domain-containing protein [Algoriphagus sp.]
MVSEVYELKFENLRINPFEGSISVFDVTLQPREKPLNSYPYINSSFRLKTDGLILESVDIMLLLESNKLDLKKISINKPEIYLDINSDNPTFFPFRDSTDVSPAGKKKSLESYFLEEFQLVDASFNVTNSVKKREFRIQNFNISLQDLLVDHHSGEDLIFLKHIDLSLEKFTGNLKEDPLQHLSFSDFKIKLDSVDLQKNLDTLIYQFQDFTAGVDTLDIQTKDSLFHVTMTSFNLSYQDQSIKLRELSFKPNVSNAVIQKNYKFQHTQFSGTVGSLDILGVSFDSLIYSNKIFIDEVLLDSVSAAIFKDNTKAKDLNHFPVYLGQTIAGIKTPIRIKQVKATNVNLTNEERKPDGTIAKVHITNATADVKNITNLAPNEELLLDAVAYLAEKVKVSLGLKFSYLNPQFSFEGGMSNFKLTDLNPIIQAYTPAKFTDGTADEIQFSGIAQRTSASGTLKFLYHDLKIDLKLQDQAKWKSSVITFGANTALLSNNPVSSDSPERVVKFKVERDVNKGFVNVIIKSILNGMKETMVMSKENRHDFNKAKKEAKREARKVEKKEKD